MQTIYYVVTTEPTFPLRHRLKEAGLKYHPEPVKLWWSLSLTAAERGAGIVGGDAKVEAREVTELPRFKPRGRSFKRGQDARRNGKSNGAQEDRNVWGEARGDNAVMMEADEDYADAGYADAQDNTATEDTATVQTDAATDDAAAKLKAVRDLLGGSVDAEMVRKLVADATKDLRAKVDALNGMAAPVRVVVEHAETGETHDCGVQHFNFPILLKACNARTAGNHRLNVWLVGPAGTGKTTAAAKVAEALGLAFWSNGALASKYELLGFADANSRTHRTPFREAWEHGGVFLWDEIDGSDNNAVLAFNQGLANGVIPFPDGMVARHTDCVIIAGANSANGGTANYNGRIRQDGAFLDRFVYLDWPLDEALERAIAPNAAWCRKVQNVRKNVAQRGVQGHLVTPRATLYGAALLAAGLDPDTVETMVLRKALNADQWAQVRG